MSVHVGYIMSRFPKITETFVLYEMKALEELGARVDVFPLLAHPDGPRHPEAEEYVERAYYTPFLSPEIAAANWRRLRRDPAAWVKTWLDALRGTWGSPTFFLGALLYYPKCVAFAEWMERLGVEHIHAHFANHPALAAFVVHRLTGIPYSFTAHGSDLHVDRRMLREKVADAVFVVTVSEYNRDLIAEECGEDAREKIAIIHCGADQEVFAEGSSPATIAGNTSTLRIACVASFEEVKGHRYLLEACRLLADRSVDFHCDILGDGPLRDDVENRVLELGLSEAITIHGAVPRPEVERTLARSDVAVLCSYPTAAGKREGIPVALMEGMMSGLPVVASGLSGIPELVDDGRTGFLVPPGDPWKLADRLQRLAARPELRRRMGRAGREKVATEFDLRDGARRLLARIERARDMTGPVQAISRDAAVLAAERSTRPRTSLSHEVGRPSEAGSRSFSNPEGGPVP